MLVSYATNNRKSVFNQEEKDDLVLTSLTHARMFLRDCLCLFFFSKRVFVFVNNKIYLATIRCLFSVPSSALRSENTYNKLLTGAKQ